MDVDRVTNLSRAPSYPHMRTKQGFIQGSPEHVSASFWVGGCISGHGVGLYDRRGGQGSPEWIKGGLADKVHGAI